jgi:hypothetical protein
MVRLFKSNWSNFSHVSVDLSRTRHFIHSLARPLLVRARVRRRRRGVLKPTVCLKSCLRFHQAAAATTSLGTVVVLVLVAAVATAQLARRG